MTMGERVPPVPRPALFSEGSACVGGLHPGFRNGLTHWKPGHSINSHYRVSPKCWAPGWRGHSRGPQDTEAAAP